MKSVLVVCSIISVIGLTACGQSNYSRVNEKQRTPSDIKISHLDLINKTIDLRFEYRTYLEKTLEDIHCKFDFNDTASLKINKKPDIKLDAFSTEILSFDSVNIVNNEKLLDLDTIDYSLECTLKYDKGSETVFEQSVLHLIPGNSYKFR